MGGKARPPGTLLPHACQCGHPVPVQDAEKAGNAGLVARPGAAAPGVGRDQLPADRPMKLAVWPPAVTVHSPVPVLVAPIAAPDAAMA